MSNDSTLPDFTMPIVLWPGEPHEMVFQPIPAGRFRMGSRGEYSDEEPRHWVRMSKPFWMAETPVTQAQYRHLADLCLDDLASIEGNEGAEPSHSKGKENHPVEYVNWHEAQVIAKALSRSGFLPPWLPSGYMARLPTEAQWEYACRAETTTEYHTGDSEAALDRAGWYDGNAGGTTHPVKLKARNDFDLYDMHGNVFEWCQDAWDMDHYGKRGAVCEDPFYQKDADSRRVIRGGSWSSSARFCRSAFRDWSGPGVRVGDQGFRLCLSSGPVENQPASPEGREAERRREREGGTTDRASGGGGAASAKAPAAEADWAEGSRLPEIPSP